MYAFGWLADIGASSLWVSECPTKFRTQNCSRKNMVRVGCGTAGDPEGTKRRTLAVFELFQLEHVKSTEG